VDLRPTDEQVQLVQAFAALYAKESSPERVRAAEPAGFDKALWEHVLAQGVVAMATAEESGGWGASLLDLTLIAEQQGRFVAPVPIIEAQVTARLLERLGASTSKLATLALHPVVGGVARLVPAGAIADQVIALVDDRLVLAEVDGRTPVENLGSMPLADLQVGDGDVLATGAAAVAAFDAAIDEFSVLAAAAVVGMAARALEITVEYVKDRRAWEQPIGSFQGVAHRLADAATAVDGARLLAYEAAWAQTAEPARFSELASMAFGFCSEAARDTSYWAVHLHGGYGFMLEYDVQLFYRRARAWTRVLASPDVAYRRVADRRYGT
jgi:alkylation response protein AidB-like acyl-CoA dehydrogenase